eukprot:3174423-Lingulodinium_polyedra.AAC.1
MCGRPSPALSIVPWCGRWHIQRCCSLQWLAVACSGLQLPWPVMACSGLHGMQHAMACNGPQWPAMASCIQLQTCACACKYTWNIGTA